MLITEVDFTLPPASSGLDLKTPTLRSAGFHVSNILRDIENRVIRPGERRPDSDLSTDEIRRMGNYREGGFILELIVDALMSGDLREGASLLLRKLVAHFFKYRMIARRKVTPQREIKFGGITGTPDALDEVNFVLEEYKCTWKASWRVENLETEFWVWFRQIMAYMHMISMKRKVWLLRARLFVFFINGDYRQSGPEIRMFDITCSEQELLENWDMIARHAAKMKGT